uniref:Uncharacterized protein n=2 Tax=Panagrolaimus sp. ES5 TaxID=591445 RepID=A0AC34F6J1_9BILA
MLHWYMTNPDYRVYDVENSPVRETSEDRETLLEGGAESLGNGSIIPSNRPSIRSRRDSTKKGQTVYLN